MPGSGEQVLRYPFGAADKQSKAYAATVAATVTNQETIIAIAELTGAVTVNLTVGSEVTAGARLTITTIADGTNRVVTAGTGMTGAAFTVTASKKATLSYVYDGTTFHCTGALLTS